MTIEPILIQPNTPGSHVATSLHGLKMPILLEVEYKRSGENGAEYFDYAWIRELFVGGRSLEWSGQKRANLKKAFSVIEEQIRVNGHCTLVGVPDFNSNYTCAYLTKLEDGKLKVLRKIPVRKLSKAEFASISSEVSSQPKDIPDEIGGATDDTVLFERRTQDLLEKFSDALIANPPHGSASPTKRRAVGIQFSRSPQVKAYILLVANGICECCGKNAPFAKDGGEAYLEVHHLVMLAEGGPDTIENAIAACPNCHRELHYGIDRKLLIERCYSKISRLRRIDL